MGYRSGLVALAGRPNVGKSTLANALAGSQVAAVSPRPQTTRRRITAVAHGDDWQAVLLDLPGFQRPADGLTARMQATVDQSLADCDAALYVLNAAEPVGGGDRFIAERLRASRLPVITVLNQIDRLTPDEVATAIAQPYGIVFRAEAAREAPGGKPPRIARCSVPGRTTGSKAAWRGTILPPHSVGAVDSDRVGWAM